MPAGVVIAEAPSGQIVLANEQSHRIWRRPLTAADDPGYGVQELRDKSGQPYLPHEWPLVRSLTAGEVVKNEEVRFPRGDGEWGTVSVSSAPIRDQGGTVVAAVAVLYDITSRKQAEEALLRAHEELERRVAERTADLARANESLRAEVTERRLVEQARNELLRRLVAVQEEERVRIARELHDQMGQQLTALKLGLESLQGPLPEGESQSERAPAAARAGPPDRPRHAPHCVGARPGGARRAGPAGRPVGLRGGVVRSIPGSPSISSAPGRGTAASRPRSRRPSTGSCRRR